MTDEKPTAETTRAPGVRVDGGRRRDLNKARVAARMANVTQAPVADAERVRLRKGREKADRLSAKRSARLQAQDGGKNGAVLQRVTLKVSGNRKALQTIRCRPGTFEWRYGKKQTALFHAGSQFAQLVERSGVTIASSANFLRGTSSGYPSGVSDGRVAALDELRPVLGGLGRAQVDRLISYCVSGDTTAEIAVRYGVKEKPMAAVLDSDLRDCAHILRFAA